MAGARRRARALDRLRGSPVTCSMVDDTRWKSLAEAEFAAEGLPHLRGLRRGIDAVRGRRSAVPWRSAARGDRELTATSRFSIPIGEGSRETSPAATCSELCTMFLPLRLMRDHRFSDPIRRRPSNNRRSGTVERGRSRAGRTPSSATCRRSSSAGWRRSRPGDPGSSALSPLVGFCARALSCVEVSDETPMPCTSADRQCTGSASQPPEHSDD